MPKHHSTTHHAARSAGPSSWLVAIGLIAGSVISGYAAYRNVSAASNVNVFLQVHQQSAGGPGINNVHVNLVSASGATCTAGSFGAYTDTNGNVMFSCPVPEKNNYQAYHISYAGKVGFTQDPNTPHHIGENNIYLSADTGGGSFLYYMMPSPNDSAASTPAPSNAPVTPSVSTAPQIVGAGQDKQPPSKPGNLSAYGGDKRIDLTWQKSVDNTLVANYTLTRSKDQVAWETINGLGNDLKYSDRNVENGTKYYYMLRAADPDGNQSEAATIDVVAGSGKTAGVAADLATPKPAPANKQISILLIAGAGLLGLIVVVAGIVLLTRRQKAKKLAEKEAYANYMRRRYPATIGSAEQRIAGAPVPVSPAATPAPEQTIPQQPQSDDLHLSTDFKLPVPDHAHLEPSPEPQPAHPEPAASYIPPPTPLGQAPGHHTIIPVEPNNPHLPNPLENPSQTHQPAPVPHRPGNPLDRLDQGQ